MLFDSADLDKVRPPRPGAPVKGEHGEEAWARAAEECAGEIQLLPMPARDQLVERLSREMELAVGHRGAGFGRSTVSDGIRRIRTASIDIGNGMTFNLQLVKAHMMRDILGVSHAAVARELQVSTSSLYALLKAWESMVKTGELPVQQTGTELGAVAPVAVDPAVLEEITQLPAKSQASAFLRAAREVDPAAVRVTGRRSRTLSALEVARIKYKEQTVAPHVMADPGGSGNASPLEVAIGNAYSGDDDYDDRYSEADEDVDDQDYPDDGVDPYEGQDLADLAMDADDARLEEYDALRSGRRWPPPSPDPCVCSKRVELRGFDADDYVKVHLTFRTRDERQVGLYECPTTGRRWHQDWPNVGPSSWGETRLRQLR